MQNLRREKFMNWPDDDGYTGKLFNLYLGISVFLSLPIAYTTYFNLPNELPNLLLAANIGTLAVMIPFVLRLRTGWSFISSRLKARITYFEADQTGQKAVKDRETLLRDRLIESTQVRPIVKRIDTSFFALFLALGLSVIGGEALVVAQGEAAPATIKTLSGDEARRFTNRLRSDEDFAREQQERAQRTNRPVYCDSRYQKILAGGNGQGGVGCSD